MCENLYGVFGFILFDANKKRVYTGRDTYGVSENNNFFIKICWRLSC
jgi:asparagine synthetase B (glutamine-hydrolysing)